MTDFKPSRQPHLSRRALLGVGTGTALFAALPLKAVATTDKMREAQIALFGDREIKTGKVNVTLPSIAENGHSVSLDIDVESPMTEDDYVKQIAVFSPRNPMAEIARYQFTPASGKASILTRIRLGGTQTVHVVAEMNDGSLWSGSAETFVTLAACVIL